MLSFERCKQILNSEGNNYTDEQIKNISEFIYQLAKVDVEFFKKSQNEKRQKSNSLQSGINNRAG